MAYESLLKTTQNTRELGGCRTAAGTFTRNRSVLRSDVQNYPDDEDCRFLQACGITTIIDLRGIADTACRPSGFADRAGFEYHNIPIDAGSGIPGSMAEVPLTYMAIAAAENAPRVFRTIAAAVSGVMINCTAGKDRTGVFSAILLMHAGVMDDEVIENYVLTKEYGRERLALVHQHFPDLDMRIVTPCRAYMRGFMTRFRARYGSTDQYFRSIGLSEAECSALRRKLVQE